MKLTSAFLVLLPGALSSPARRIDKALLERQTIQEVTDELLFTVTLPTFISRRNAKNPPTLDWSSDGCTDSPDNPFGFPFIPACYRHDFGYQNYRAQSRFTDSGKLNIDNNFKSDLYYQCNSTSAKTVCKALADVYYAAVRAFGGGDASPGKREEDLIAIYEEKLAIYNKLVEEAQKNGELPYLD
ncbi:prokaryotic phospholipase A2-domain-containing protein [Mariannaea sp. PMI_226]|nr:prokaryotic phospholipase A2-domain-containing protein [Mariannaea sp. PMI_226]